MRILIKIAIPQCLIMCFDRRMKNRTELPARTERLRYAPSPTGPLHMGNLSTALFTYYRAKSINANLILRMDSLDPIRCKDPYAQDIVSTLNWIGLEFNGPIHHQHPYQKSFQQAFSNLKEMDLVYPCFCSRKVALKLTAQGGHIYSGACRNLAPSFSRKRINNGEPHCWRFRVQCDGVTFEDMAMGQLEIPSTDWGGDFIVWRRDNCPSYPLATVIDDSDLQITEINRGRDLIAPSAAQTLLFKALKKEVPRFLHFPLLTDAHGKKLSKRNHDASPEKLFPTGQAFIRSWASAFHIALEDLKGADMLPSTIITASKRDNILFKTT